MCVCVRAGRSDLFQSISGKPRSFIGHIPQTPLTPVIYLVVDLFSLMQAVVTRALQDNFWNAVSKTNHL